MDVDFGWRSPFDIAADNLESGAADPYLAWVSRARPNQLPPKGFWRTWLLTGGRGSGKTDTGANTLASWIFADEEPGEWGIVAPTYKDAWTTCVEGESGVLRALGTTMAEVKKGKSKIVKAAWRSHGEVILHNGHLIRADSANDGALRVQGKNLKGCWCDEIGLWRLWNVAWDESIQYAVRQGISRIVATGTPKVSRPAAKLIRRLIRTDEDVVHTRLKTVENLDNLSESFFRAVVSRSKGTRLEKQELEGELLDDVEGALWSRDLIDRIIVDQLPADGNAPGRPFKTFIGIDPSDGETTSDEQAYTVIGKCSDNKLYVVESWGDRVPPAEFLKKAVQAAIKWNAQIVIEKNHGGAYLIETLLQVFKDLKVRVPYRKVSASQGKMTRAEPISLLYERGVVRHVHWIDKDTDGNPFVDDSMVELEDQMATFTGAANEKSPDRLDSLVWAAWPFLDDTFETSEIPSGPKRYAALAALDKMDEHVREWAQRTERMKSRMAGPNQPDGVHDPDLLERMPNSRPNVHRYLQRPGW